LITATDIDALVDTTSCDAAKVGYRYNKAVMTALLAGLIVLYLAAAGGLVAAIIVAFGDSSKATAILPIIETAVTGVTGTYLLKRYKEFANLLPKLGAKVDQQCGNGVKETLKP
jgi:hypothetical protein